MTITLTRSIPLQTTVAFLKLEREESRPDIQKYLSGEHDRLSFYQ